MSKPWEKWVPISVHLLDTQTGERAVCAAQGWFEEDGRFHSFWWLEGNGSCDCNRGELFAKARGNEDPDQPCGHSRYRLERIVEDGTGKVLVEGEDR